MSQMKTAFDKPFGANIVDANDALYRTCEQINEIISSLEIARNQAKTDKSVAAIEQTQKMLREQQNALEKMKHYSSDFGKLLFLYDDEGREEITEDNEIEDVEVF